MSRPIPVDKTKAGSSETSASDYTSVVKGAAIVSASAAQTAGGSGGKPAVSISASVASAAKSAVFANPVVSIAARQVYVAQALAAAYVPPEWRWPSTRFLGAPFPLLLIGSFNGSRIMSNHGGQARAYITTDGGLTWVNNTFIATPAGLSVGAMSYDGTKVVIAAVSDSINYSTNGGLNWTTITPSPNINRAWRSIVMSSDGAKMAVAEGDLGYIYTTSNSGSSWTQRTASGARYWVWIAGTSDCNTLIAGVASDSYISADGGVTWSASRSTGVAGALNHVISSSDGSVLFGLRSSTTTLFKSTNSGATWTAIGPTKNWRGIAMSANGEKMVGALNGEVWLSEDSGTTWTKQITVGGDMRPVYISGDGTRIAVADHADSKVYFASYT